MLVGAYEDHGGATLHKIGNGIQLADPEPVAENAKQHLTGGRRTGYAHQLLELVDGAGRTGAAGDDTALRPRINRTLDDLLGLVQALRHAPPSDVILGMRIGVAALQLYQVVFYEVETTARGGVVAVHHQAPSKGNLEGGVYTHNLFA